MENSPQKEDFNIEKKQSKRSPLEEKLSSSMLSKSGKGKKYTEILADIYKR